MSGKPQNPAIEGWHTMEPSPHLIGTRCKSGICGGQLLINFAFHRCNRRRDSSFCFGSLGGEGG